MWPLWAKFLEFTTEMRSIFPPNFVNTFGMKKHLTIEQAKALVSALAGRKVLVKLNKGRNRILKCKGVVVEVHPNVFVVEVAGEIFDRISCSYVDMICGEVALSEQSAT